MIDPAIFDGDPPMRPDGLCAVCLKPRHPERSKRYARANRRTRRFLLDHVRAEVAQQPVACRGGLVEARQRTKVRGRMNEHPALFADVHICDGSSECKAKKHLHGCYSDNGRNCDHPSEHLRVGMVVGDDGQLRRFA